MCCYALYIDVMFLHVYSECNIIYQCSKPCDNFIVENKSSIRAKTRRYLYTAKIRHVRVRGQGHVPAYGYVSIAARRNL